MVVAMCSHPLLLYYIIFVLLCVADCILCVMHNVLYAHVLLYAMGKYTYGTLNLTPAEAIRTPVVCYLIRKF